MVQMVVTSVVQYVLRSLGQNGYDFISNPCRDVTNVLLSLDRPMVYTDNEVYRIVFFGSIYNFSHPFFLGVAGMFSGQNNEKDTAGLVSVIVFCATADTLVGKVLIVVMCGISLHTRVVVSFMVSHGCHDGEIR